MPEVQVICGCGEHRDLPTRWFCAWMRMGAGADPLTWEQLARLSWYLSCVYDDEGRYPSA